MQKKLAVLVSGKGTTLQAMLHDGVPVELVLTDRECPGAEIARVRRIQTIVLERISDRGILTRTVKGLLRHNGVTHVALAGWLRIFDAAMFEGEDGYAGKMLNLHPSLLPAFPGNHAVRDALRYGVKVAGCTIHVVTPELDAGPIVAQEPVPVHEGDTEETLHERIKVVERSLYPKVICSFLSET